MTHSKNPNYWKEASQRRQETIDQHQRLHQESKDAWHWHSQNNWLTRIHHKARTTLFTPMGVAAVPRQADLQKLRWRTKFRQTGRDDAATTTSWRGITVFSAHHLAFEPRSHYDHHFEHIDLNNYFEHIDINNHETTSTSASSSRPPSITASSLCPLQCASSC
eukprot:2958405-Amphidinium_carterae.6